uniref:Uncharacterized protein n=1 Tax=Anguilla anguilla TaxID=7936 RepID=A0A0E9T0J8_ANGAN
MFTCMEFNVISVRFVSILQDLGTATEKTTYVQPMFRMVLVICTEMFL